MSATTNAPVVTESAYLTLHYRLATADGTDIVTTFGSTPATLMLGQGQLAPFLEQRLLGMAEGTHQVFELSAAEGFGERNPDLIQTVSKKTLDENSELGRQLPGRRPGRLRRAGWRPLSPGCCANCATMPPSSTSTIRWPDSR